MKRSHSPAFRLLILWLAMVSRVVPRPLRGEWREEWEGELWYALNTGRQSRRVVRIAAGILSDAFDVRRSFRTSVNSPTRGDPVISQFVSDIRFAVRTFRRTPLFTLVAVLTIALGVGATTGLFTVVNTVLLRPLPYADADRLVNLWQSRSARGIERDWFSGAQYVDIRDGSDVFEMLAFGGGGTVTVTGRGEPFEAGYAAVTSPFFPMFGVTPAYGRLLDASDEQEGANRVILLSDALWRRSFGSDPTAVGQTLTINQTDFEIVGILPAEFTLNDRVLPTVAGTGSIDILASFRLTESRLANRGSENYNIVGQLKPGVTVAQAQAQMDAVAQTIIERFEEEAESGFSITVTPLLEQVVGSVRRPLVALLIAGGVLLAIACANVVNLLLSRSAQRHHEFSIRAALGARRPRLVRQLLTESILLALVGSIMGTGLAFAVLRGLRRVGPVGLPRLDELAIDGSVLLFGAALMTVVTVAFGLIPALQASNVRPGFVMRAGTRGISGHASWNGINPSSGLVVLEVALAVVLLVGAGLLIRSFRALEHVDPGFVTDDVLTFRIRLVGEPGAESGGRSVFFATLEDRLEALPSVQSVGGVHILPFTLGATWGSLNVEGSELDDELIAHFRIATPGYFETMRIPLVRGRVFDRRDREGSPPVVVIEEQMAERLFPGEDPIGRRIEGWSSDWAEIVGVVGSVKMAALDEDAPLMAYYPAAQTSSTGMYYSVRSAGGATTVAADVERIVREMGSSTLLTDLTPMRQRVSSSLASRRFAMIIFQGFGLAALLLATVGVYGLLAYRVNLGTREIGMRLALGAQRRDIVLMVLRHGMSLAAAGALAGGAISVGVTGLMSSMLFNTAPTDLVTYGAVLGFLTFVLLMACLIPATRAALADPVRSLTAS